MDLFALRFSQIPNRGRWRAATRRNADKSIAIFFFAGDESLNDFSRQVSLAALVFAGQSVKPVITEASTVKHCVVAEVVQVNSQSSSKVESQAINMAMDFIAAFPENCCIV